MVEFRGWWIVLDALSWIFILIVFGMAVFGEWPPSPYDLIVLAGLLLASVWGLGLIVLWARRSRRARRRPPEAGASYLNGGRGRSRCRRASSISARLASPARSRMQGTQMQLAPWATFTIGTVPSRTWPLGALRRESRQEPERGVIRRHPKQKTAVLGFRERVS